MSNRAPNPFADEPLPPAQRLQSAADPLNPYAAPVGVAEYQVQQGPGPGVWQNGDLIVIHQSLDMPERCIWTNQPTNRRFTQQFAFSTWLGLRNWSIPFAYSFSRAALRRVFRSVLIGLGIASASLLIIIALIASDQNGWLHLAWLTPQFLITLAIGVGMMWQQLQSPLSLIHQEQGYFCIRGAKEPFLRSLPNWPGLHGSIHTNEPRQQ